MENEKIVSCIELRKVEGTFRYRDGSIYKQILFANADQTEEDWKNCFNMMAEISDSELVSFEAID